MDFYSPAIQDTDAAIGVAAIGAMGAKAPLTRKGICLSGTNQNELNY